jgi:transposase
MKNDHDCQYRSALEEIKSQLNQALERNGQLESELLKYKNPPKDSGNSSKPPSTDQSRKNRYPSREKSDKKVGGQEGHQGKSHPFSETPDHVIVCEAPTECQHCHSLDLGHPEIGERRQVVDIPEPKVEVTEYQQQRVYCNACGKVSRSQFPEGVDGRVQIGKRAQSLAVLLKTVHALSGERLVGLFSDAFGLNISQGWVENTVTKLATYFLPIYAAILVAIVGSGVAGSDETGNHVNGKRVWTWVFQTVGLVYFKTAESRGFKVIEELIGKTFSGTWISDRFSAQLKLIALFNQWCLAHIIRECRFLIQSENDAWATQLKMVLSEAIAFRNKHENYDPQMHRLKIEAFEKQVAECFGLDPPKSEKGQGIFKKLRLGQDRMLRFLYDPIIPPTNNDSERPLRHWALLKKVFGGFRSLEGIRRYDVLLSVIQSAKRQNLNVLDVLSGKAQLSISPVGV